MILDAPRLIRLQVELEYRLDLAGRLVPFPGGSEQARVIVYWHAQGYARFFRFDLPEAQRLCLMARDPALAFDDPASVAGILGADLPPEGIPVFVSGVIAAIPWQEPESLAVLREGCWVIEVEGKPIAWAWSARSNAESAELAVEVDPDHRRRGYGRRVAAVWARQVIEAGQVAFYSYRTTNLPSLALARSLGVQGFAHCVAFD